VNDLREAISAYDAYRDLVVGGMALVNADDDPADLIEAARLNVGERIRVCQALGFVGNGAMRITCVACPHRPDGGASDPTAANTLNFIPARAPEFTRNCIESTINRSGQRSGSSPSTRNGVNTSTQLATSCPSRAGSRGRRRRRA
jgi:hypothetical protein